MEKACPIDAAKVIDPGPNAGILLEPEGALRSIQHRKTQYPTQLTIPYARSDTPN